MDFSCVVVVDFFHSGAPGSSILCFNLIATTIFKQFLQIIWTDLNSIKYLYYTEVYPIPEVMTLADSYVLTLNYCYAYITDRLVDHLYNDRAKLTPSSHLINICYIN